LDQLQKIMVTGELKQTNRLLDELVKHRNIINYVRAQRLSWFGHTNRVSGTDIVQKIYRWKPFTGRPVGRPKSGWEVTSGMIW
jgi:hypothetical protein